MALLLVVQDYVGQHVQLDLVHKSQVVPRFLHPKPVYLELSKPRVWPELTLGCHEPPPNPCLDLKVLARNACCAHKLLEQCSAVQCSVVQRSAIYCSAEQCDVLLGNCYAVQRSAMYCSIHAV